MKEQFNVVIESKYIKSLKKIAIDRGLTTSELVEEIFKREVNSYEK